LYVPKSFEAPSQEAMHDVICRYPLATVVTQGEAGLTANHLPTTLEQGIGPLGSLRCHVARSNSMWRECSADTHALAIFQGPDCYVSPNWYPSKGETGEVVPTWNYIVVHAHGNIRIIDDRDWLLSQVDKLTQHHESTFPRPWSLSDAPDDYVEKMLKSIVGLEFTITRLEGKWKLSQNRSEPDRAGVVAGLRQQNATVMADLVERPHG
jgi:transcriptional regulator